MGRQLGNEDPSNYATRSNRPVVDADKMIHIEIEAGQHVIGAARNILSLWDRRGYRFTRRKLIATREVTIPADFYIDPTPVTNRQYQRFLEETGLRQPDRAGKDPRIGPYQWRDGMPPEDREDYPVVLVSHADAVAYAEWAGKRLPTADEWEVAARWPDGWLYPWGNEWQHSHCNSLEWWAKQETSFSFRELEAWQWQTRILLEEAPRLMTTPVRFFAPNSAGLFDLAGNVWEWTSTGTEDTEIDDMTSRQATLKGGAWFFGAVEASAASYAFLPPGERLPYVGFRCVADCEHVERTLLPSGSVRGE